MIVLVIILSSAPHQQGCSIFMTTSPSFNEHPSYFLVQNAIGTLDTLWVSPGPRVPNTPSCWSSPSARAYCSCLPRGLASSGKDGHWSSQAVSLFSPSSPVCRYCALIEFVASVWVKVVARVDVGCILQNATASGSGLTCRLARRSFQQNLLRQIMICPSSVPGLDTADT